MDDQEKLSLRKQVEILNLQKDVLSRQLSKLRNDIVAERSTMQQKQTKLLDDIRVKDIEIRAVRNYMEKRDHDAKAQLRDEFHALKIEKERIAEVTKEVEARRNLIENLITEKQSEFEKRLQTEKALFEKSRGEYLKNTKKTQAALEEHIHKGAVAAKQSEEEINNLREQAASASSDTSGKDGIIEELKKEVTRLENEKASLTREFDEKINTFTDSEKSTLTLKKSAEQIKAAMFAREKEIAGQNTKTKEKISELSWEIEKLKKDNKHLTKLNGALEKKLSKKEASRQKKREKPATKPEPPGTTKFKCSECGAIVGANDKKCPECGEKFE